jgi:hypothetical protein
LCPQFPAGSSFAEIKGPAASQALYDALPPSLGMPTAEMFCQKQKGLNNNGYN